MDHLEEVDALLERASVGLLLDLDGTISQIVPEPDEASVSPAIRTALQDLHLKLPLLAIVTGRHTPQARDIVGLDDLVYVGNHGLERLEKGRVTLAKDARPFVPFLEQIRERLQARVNAPGLVFEDKGGPFAIHYRLAEDPEKACSDVLEAVEDLSEGRVRVLMGKTVINILPPVDLTKGTAVISLVNECGLSGAILMGDDVTDIDLFSAANAMSGREGFRSISIAVVGPGSPPELERQADFTLSSVSEVGDFLAWLVAHAG